MYDILVYTILIILGPGLIILGIYIHYKTTKQCPYCKERINKKAIKCPHCQSDLQD